MPFKMNNVFLIRKIKYYLNPAFIEKQSILKSVKYLINKYKKELSDKSLLDIGCGSNPYRSFFERLNMDYKGIDFKDYSANFSFGRKEPDFYFDENYKKDFKLPQFGNESYDILAAFQVIEHHKNIDMFFSEVKRILKKGGYLILSFPFIWELHEEPNDFQRLTHYKIRNICGHYNFKIVEQIKRGSSLSTISQLINLSLFNTKIPEIIKLIIYLIFLLPFQYLTYIYDSISSNPKRKVFLGYTFLLQKL